jgi:hypothetical protein
VTGPLAGLTRARWCRHATATATAAAVTAALVVPGLLAIGAAGAATTSPLSHFLIKSGEEPGYSVSGRPTTITTAAGMVAGGSLSKSQSQSIISALRKAGFVKAVEENTKGTGSNEGLSLVIQFSSPAGAKTGAALLLHLAKTGQGGTKPFTVAGVPGAQGVTLTGSAGGSANAYWSTGDCVLGSGLYDGTAISAKAAASPVEAGIRSQAKRVGATCP